jgi:hypothetical protein
VTLSDEQIQDLLRVGNPTDEECRLLRLGWDAAMRERTAMSSTRRLETRAEAADADNGQSRA